MALLTSSSRDSTGTSTLSGITGGLATAVGRKMGPGTGVASPLPGSTGRVVGDETDGTEDDDSVDCRGTWIDSVELFEGAGVDEEPEAKGAGLVC